MPRLVAEDVAAEAVAVALEELFLRAVVPVRVHADGVRAAFGERCTFDLGTVNDEQTFSGRLSVVVMLFEAGGKTADGATIGATTDSSRRGRRSTKNPLSVGPQGRGRFYNAEQTIWRGEDLDRPTYLRRNISLDL